MKKRLDQILFEEGYYASREKAQRAIMAGLVFINGQCEDKAGTKFDTPLKIEIKGAECPYVSRGGYKLAKALDVFHLDVQNKTALDVGASTGGFTDCLLQNGVAKVYAVDVGYGQLAWTLRNDPRVVVLEKTNARYLTKEILPEMFDLMVCDVSFISLTKIIPAIGQFMKEDAFLVTLIKPQFEAGRELVHKGVVKDPAVHMEVLRKTITFIEESGWFLAGLDYSPVLGPEGNREFVAWWKRGRGEVDLETLIVDVVKMAHEEL